ncbi:hypothetical protein XELAEV_18031461mg [Xenopus laevis]|uniref:Uncharacterized protein n=1 Tax=Xenopus laevis TaxID=8355 RepID=A0A974CPA5_XENLA|nr:hypothetical protein XELAEV_18031461mg [Xenopus laevis]
MVSLEQPESCTNIATSFSYGPGHLPIEILIYLYLFIHCSIPVHYIVDVKRLDIPFPTCVSHFKLDKHLSALSCVKSLLAGRPYKVHHNLSWPWVEFCQFIVIPALS